MDNPLSSLNHTSMGRRFTTPFNTLLGIEVERVHSDGVALKCNIRDDLRNNKGVLHGGVTATLVDAAVGISIHYFFKERRSATTVEMKLNYFLPLTTGKIRARCRLLRVGTTLVVGSVEVRDAKRKLAAFGTATYKLLD